MRLQVKGRHVDVTDSLFQYAEKKLGKLARHLSDESRCELELIVEHNPSISDSQEINKDARDRLVKARPRDLSVGMNECCNLPKRDNLTKAKSFAEGKYS